METLGQRSKPANGTAPPALEDESIQIVKTSELTLFRQIVRLTTQEEFVSVVERMWILMRKGKFTGRMIVSWNMGGVSQIETEEETK